jgi:hypothetical protein
MRGRRIPSDWRAEGKEKLEREVATDHPAARVLERRG